MLLLYYISHLSILVITQDLFHNLVNSMTFFSDCLCLIFRINLLCFLLEHAIQHVFGACYFRNVHVLASRTHSYQLLRHTKSPKSVLPQVQKLFGATPRRCP